MISRANFIKPGKVVHFLGKPYRILLVNPKLESVNIILRQLILIT